ncbi:MAG: hypothetical protein ACTSRG_16145 [Candidatus Helarchaeota archaeon]
MLNKIPTKLSIIFINNLLKIRENKKSVGTFKFSGPSIGEIIGGKLTYKGTVIKIKNHISAKGDVLEFNNKYYQFLDKEVRDWQSKKKLIVIKIRNNTIYLQNNESKLSLKVKSIGETVKFEFLDDTSDFYLYLIAGIFFFFKIIILREMIGELESSL